MLPSTAFWQVSIMPRPQKALIPGPPRPMSARTSRGARLRRSAYHQSAWQTTAGHARSPRRARRPERRPDPGETLSVRLRPGGHNWAASPRPGWIGFDISLRPQRCGNRCRRSPALRLSGPGGTLTPPAEQPTPTAPSSAAETGLVPAPAYEPTPSTPPARSSVGDQQIRIRRNQQELPFAT